MSKSNKPLDRLKYHVTGAIERGETKAIEAVVASKHTPGPYGLNYLNNSNYQLTADNGTYIGTLDLSSCIIPEENNSTARLIAAAPDLLEALERLETEFDYAPAAYEIIKTAIAKARGES